MRELEGLGLKVEGKQNCKVGREPYQPTYLPLLHCWGKRLTQGAIVPIYYKYERFEKARLKVE